jgi:hypothetical protein
LAAIQIRRIALWALISLRHYLEAQGPGAGS